MPFLGITLRGFKNHKNTVVRLSDNKTIISGENGEGKTSIIEAMIWALTGKDFMGGGDPKSYINHEEERADVLLEHSNFSIVRGISRKSSQTIKFKKATDKDYITVTQSDLENMLKINFQKLSSVCNVGFFMGLDPKERRDVLRTIVKTKPVKEIVEEYLGKSVPNIPKVTFTNAKKDLAVITPLRLKAEREGNSVTGAIGEQKKILEAVGVAEDESVLTVERNKLQKTLDLMNQFIRDKTAFDMAKSSMATAVKNYEMAQNKIHQIDAEMEILSTPILPPQELVDKHQKMVDSRPNLVILSPPAPPVFTELPESSCYTCGQAVTEKVKMAFTNRKIAMMDEYERACASTTQSNIKNQQALKTHDDAVKALAAHINEYHVKEHDRKERFNSLQRERINLSQIKQPDLPHEPTTSLDISQKPEIEKKIQEITGKIQTIITMRTRIEAAQNRIKELEKEMEHVKGQWHLYSTVESALKAVPGIELKMIKSSIEVPGYELIILTEDDEPYGIDFSKNGTRYSFLSKGEKLRLNCFISQKLCDLLLKPDGKPLLPLFFIDDQELLSDKSVFETMVGQKIITKVDSGKFQVVQI